MKHCSSMLVALSFTLFTNVVYADTQDVDIALEEVHVPLGFDSNDTDVEIVVTGVVPDTCYRRPQGMAKVNGSTISVDMKAVKVTGRDVVCIQAVVPYIATISLGQLPEGKYDIKVNQGRVSEKASILFVAKPSSQSIDNFTYANVTSVEFMREKGMLVLKGEHPSSCMNIGRIEVMPNLNQNTFAILPIVQQEREICDRMMKPFTYEVPIPSTVQDQTIVFHVRKIAGNAINIRS